MDDEWDVARDEFINDLYNDFASDLLSEHGDLYVEVIEQFALERLQSFYLDNPDLAMPALDAFKEASTLVGIYPSAAHVFAVTAADVGLKAILLKPILYGLVHTDSLAAMIADLLPEQRNEKFRELLFAILKEYGGVDLEAYKRPGVAQTAWEELSGLHQKRNRILHKAEKASQAEAQHALALAATVLEEFFPTVIKKLGLQIRTANGKTTVWGQKRGSAARMQP
jgi:hypothetical protein